MIRAPKVRAPIPGLPTTRVVGPGGGAQRPQDRAGTGAMIRRHLPGDVGTPALETAIVGRLLGAKTMTGAGRAIVNMTVAAGPADASGTERGAHHRLVHVHRRHAGVGHRLDGISGEKEASGMGGTTIEGDEMFYRP